MLNEFKSISVREFIERIEEQRRLINKIGLDEYENYLKYKTIELDISGMSLNDLLMGIYVVTNQYIKMYIYNKKRISKSDVDKLYEIQDWLIGILKTPNEPCI